MKHLLCALVLLTPVALTSIFASPAAALEVGDPFPSMALTDLDGETHDLAAQTGDVLVIYFLGFSCLPCADIADAIEGDFVIPYRGERVRVFGVDAWDGQPDELARLRNQAGVRYPFLLNGGALLNACDLEWHSFVVVDGRGIVRYVNQTASGGSYDPAAMKSVVDAHLTGAVETEIVTWGEIKRFYDPTRRDAERPVLAFP